MEEVSVKELARITQMAVTAQKYMLSKMSLPDSPRMRVVLALLLACMDHARSAALLLRTDPDTTGVSAMALLRPQVETFCRAIMFSVASEVSDEEVRAFIEKDELPRRIPANGGRKRDIFAKAVQAIAMREVNAIAAELVGDQNSAIVITAFVEFDESVLHSFVHGGGELARLYDSGANELGFTLSRETAQALLFHVGRLSMAALSFAGARLASAPVLDEGLLWVAWSAFCEHVAEMPMDRSAPPTI